MVKHAGFTLIELLVVMGIAALLMTMAATSFFGASRRDNITKSRDQLCDILRLARQQASIVGKTHVVVCWNATTKIKVGDKEVAGGKQGRYALFEYVGNVWPTGTKLAAPFGLQRETLEGITKNARLININDPDKDFMRVSKSRMSEKIEEGDDANKSSDTKVSSLRVDYKSGGKRQTFNVDEVLDQQDGGDGTLWVATLRKGASETKAFPLGMRTSQTYSLPKDYAFNQDQAVFIFTADGRLESGSATSITAKHSMSKNADNATFNVSITSEGVITRK